MGDLMTDLVKAREWQDDWDALGYAERVVSLAFDLHLGVLRKCLMSEQEGREFLTVLGRVLTEDEVQLLEELYHLNKDEMCEARARGLSYFQFLELKNAILSKLRQSPEFGAISYLSRLP